MFSEKFPEKVDSQSEEQSLLEASFLREMGGHTLFQRGSRRNGFRESVPLRPHLGRRPVGDIIEPSP
jgi:hypothetical protein